MKLLVVALLGLVAVVQRSDASYSAAHSVDSAVDGFLRPGGPWFQARCDFFGCRVCTGYGYCAHHDSPHSGRAPIGAAVHTITCPLFGGCEICTDNTASTGRPPLCLGHSLNSGRPGGAGEEEHLQQAPLGASPDDHPDGGFIMPPWFDAICRGASCRVCVHGSCSRYRGGRPIIGAPELGLRCFAGGWCHACYGRECEGRLASATNSIGAEQQLQQPQQKQPQQQQPQQPQQPQQQQPLGAFLPAIIYSRHCEPRGCNVCIEKHCTFLPGTDPWHGSGPISSVECTHFMCKDCVDGYCANFPNPWRHVNLLQKLQLGCRFDKTGRVNCSPPPLFPDGSYHH